MTTWQKDFEELSRMLGSDKLHKWTDEFLEDLYLAFEKRRSQEQQANNTTTIQPDCKLNTSES